jgi:hypothetical protein
MLKISWMIINRNASFAYIVLVLVSLFDCQGIITVY